MCYISKILKIESNSQHAFSYYQTTIGCVISQRYSKLKAIHNYIVSNYEFRFVVLYLKDTQNWKQFTTGISRKVFSVKLCYISKILKIESNSQLQRDSAPLVSRCVISQRYSKLKAIHNPKRLLPLPCFVVLYLKDTQNWKQFTTHLHHFRR